MQTENSGGSAVKLGLVLGKYSEIRYLQMRVGAIRPNYSDLVKSGQTRAYSGLPGLLGPTQ